MQIEPHLHTTIQELLEHIKSLRPVDGFSSPRDLELVTQVNKESAVLNKLEEAMQILVPGYLARETGETLAESFERKLNPPPAEDRAVVTIAVWPDGEWCYMDHLEVTLSYKSDDYAIIHPSIIDEECIEEAVQQHMQS